MTAWDREARDADWFASRAFLSHAIRLLGGLGTPVLTRNSYSLDSFDSWFESGSRTEGPPMMLAAYPGVSQNNSCSHRPA